MGKLIREYDLPIFILLLLILLVGAMMSLVAWDASTEPLRYCIEVPRG